MCILNTGAPTCLHKQTNSLTCIDLTLISPDIFIELEWEFEEDLHGSDHFPCCIKLHSEQVVGREIETRYSSNKADWKLYKL